MCACAGTLFIRSPPTSRADVALRDRLRALVRLARARRRVVRVGLLRARRRRLEVREAVVHEAAVAPLVALRLAAVHQLLLREGHQLASRDLPRALQRARRAEGPAQTRTSTLSCFEKVCVRCQSAICYLF